VRVPSLQTAQQRPPLQQPPAASPLRRLFVCPFAALAGWDPSRLEQQVMLLLLAAPVAVTGAALHQVARLWTDRPPRLPPRAWRQPASRKQLCLEVRAGGSIMSRHELVLCPRVEDMMSGTSGKPDSDAHPGQRQRPEPSHPSRRQHDMWARGPTMRSR